jgi:hypothetical protein
VKVREHLLDSRKDGVVLPSFAVVAAAVLGGQSNPVFFASVRQNLDCPLLNRRTDKAIQRSGVGNLAGFENFLKATNDARLRVSESPIQVEDERWERSRHGPSLADES